MAIDLATIAAGTGGFVIHGQDGGVPSDGSGWSVASAGDVNGDGFDDLIIGAPSADAAGNAKDNAGDSYVVFGKASGWGAAIDLATIATGTGGFVIHGQDANDYSGWSVASAGDVNGDGFGDLIIGARNGDAAGNAKDNAGDSYVVFGKASGWGAAIDLATGTGTGGFVIHGQDANDYSGYSVASAGDVNGDGFGDLIIGALFADAAGNAKAEAGDSYVVFGKAGGFGAAIDLATIAAGTGGFVIHGQDRYDQSGRSVASAGDVNGDGFDDLVIGAPRADAAGNAKSSAGDSYVVFGKASGWGAAIDLATIAAGTGGFVIHGQDANDYSGRSVAAAGDVNGDGFGDLIIGASGGDAAGNARSSAGDSYVVFGKATGWGAAIDLATIAAGTGGFVIHGQDSFDYSGFSVASAGDVNGDGFDDLIIGAVAGDAAGNAKDGAGDSYVVFGKAGGFGAAIDLATIAAGTGGFVIQGEDLGDESGRSVASAGDVNGDGFDDLVIGAPFADAAGNAKSNAGDSYVVFGRDFTGIVTHAGTAAAETLTGTAAADIMVAGQGNDTLLGQGGVDALAGGAGNDRIVVGNLAFRRVDGGSGTDTLVLSGTGLTLNLASIGNSKLQGIEAIDLTGAGNNALRLTALEVLNLSDTSNTLRIIGNAGDGLALLDAGWTDAGVVGGIRRLTKGQAVLQIDQAITIGPNLSGTTGADSLVGSTGNDTLIGLAGNDTLDGGLGADSLIGGAGDDLYRVDSALDRVVELAGGGLDRVISTASLTLAAEVENLTLGGVLAINATGNVLNNAMTGNAAANRLAGGNGGDTLAGLGGIDTLDGGGGNDWLDGGTGADSLAGGIGNDTYVVDNAGDVVTEAAGAGLDTVLASVSHTLATNVEALTLLGAAASGTGNTGNNVLTGNALANTLVGLAGNDSLLGLNGNDTLDGGDGNDTLDGGLGADSMAGGTDNDVYLVNSALDRVVELAGGGIDRVISTVSLNLMAEVENLTLGGALALNANGNALNNAITGNDAANRLNGGLGNDTVSGLGGDDVLLGAAGTDSLLGGGGNDTLAGGLGTDTLVGGTENDLYLVDATADVVRELAAQGLDTVQAAASFTLGLNLEDLLLTGAATINGTGNGLANRITGNGAGNLLDGGSGNDTLSGGGGGDTLLGGIANDVLDGGDGDDVLAGGAWADTLTGGAGADAFRFGASTEGVDRITDFTSGLDRFEISTAGFGGLLPLGALDAGNFSGSGVAVGAVPQFVYVAATGALRWDADGAGGTASVAIAIIEGAPLLTATDIVVIA